MVDDKWRTIPCVHCNGYGMVSDYRGGDFNGAEECNHCSLGLIWIRPSGHLFMYPGGAAAGMGTTEEYVKAQPVVF